MNLENLVIKNRNEFLLSSLKSFNKSLKDLKQDIDILKRWCEQQKYLPEIPSDNVLTAFLFISQFSIEIAKQRVDTYYTMRDILPEIYMNKNPQLPHMQIVFDQAIIVPFPKTTCEGYRVIYLCFKSGSEVNFDTNAILGQILNIVEILIHEDVPVGTVVMVNLENVTLGHLRHVTPAALKNIVIILENLKNVVKQVHFLNFPSMMEPLKFILKNIFKENAGKMKICYHEDNSTVFNYTPKVIFPKDLGGDEISIETLQELWKEKIRQYQWRFDALDKMKVKKDLIPISLKNDEILGFHGNFKKLDID